MSRNLLCVFSIVISYACAQDLFIGDRCVHQFTSQDGICKTIDECPHVANEANRELPPTICGYLRGRIPIVCCTDDNFRPPFSNTPPSPNDNLFSNGMISFPEDDGFNNREQFPTNSISKSEKKCIEYTKSVTSLVQAIPLVTDTEPINISIEKCDYNSVELIVGGQPASAGEFPFMAALGYNIENQLKWLCGATLISDQYVLTAAHCTFSRDSDGPKIIRLGDLDLTRTDDSDNEDYLVGNIIVHPNYKYPQKYNDIALIQSRQRIKFTKYIRPACLHNRRDIEQNTAIATGWGKTGWAESENSDKLRKVTLNIYSKNRCHDTYGTDKNIPRGVDESMICAGELKGGDTCQGDSGGPLLITRKENQCKFYVVGITSFGKSCGQVPGVYTKVSNFVPWIESVIW